MPSKVEKPIIEQLAPLFMTYNFEWLPQLNQFRCSGNYGFQNIIITVNEPSPELVDIKLGTRIEMVERLAHQFTTGLSLFQEHSNTLIASMGEILEQPYFLYEINDEAEIGKICREIESFMLDKGFPLLEKYTKVNQLDRLFNEYPHQKLVYTYHYFNRCLRGIVLARISGREDFSKLVEIYRAELLKKNTAPQLVERYDQLAVFLEAFSLN